MDITMGRKIRSLLAAVILLGSFGGWINAQDPSPQTGSGQAPGQPEALKKVEAILGKAKQLSDAVKWVLAKIDPLREKMGLIPKEVEIEMHQLVSRLLSTMDEKKYGELMQKYKIKTVGLTHDQLREKLLNDPDFRVEMAERVSCSLYRVFRLFGWHSVAEARQGNVDKYYERLRIVDISLLEDPISNFIQHLVRKMSYTFFDDDGTIRIDGSKAIQGECAATVATVQLLKNLFPNTWQYLLDENKVDEIYDHLEQAKRISWEPNVEYPGLIEFGLNKLSLSSDRLVHVLEQKAKNIGLIKRLARDNERQKRDAQITGKKRRYASRLAKYRQDPLYAIFARKNDVEKALKMLEQRDREMHEFANQFGLDRVKDNDVKKLLYQLAQYKNNIPKSLEIIFGGSKDLIIAQDAPSHIDQKVYKALFDEHGVYKLIVLFESFVGQLQLPKDKVGLKKYKRLRKLLNLYILLRQEEVGTRYQEIVELGLEVIKKTFNVSTVKRMSYEKALEKLYAAIKKHDKVKINEILKHLNKR